METQKKEPKEILKGYYQDILKLEKEIEKGKAKMIAATEIMGLSPEEANEILGATVFSPIKPVVEPVSGGASKPVGTAEENKAD